MGLDMYLYRYNKDEKVLDCFSAGEDCSICNGCKGEEIYWRKSNQIHKWFVDNVQNGIDDCGRYEVSINKLIELRDLCKKVLNNENLACSLLPVSSGFFFGSLEYDEYYFDDIERTMVNLDRIISSDKEEFKYVYHSSW